MTMTRYWRDQQVGFLGRALTGLGLLDFGKIGGSKYIFSKEGYAIVSVDARGTGASFGSRRIEWDPEEIKDYGEIATWITQQSWSNGRVGAYGVSYDGNTAELISLNHHPAIKAVAPLYGDYDPQYGLTLPGGAQTNYLDYWGAMTAAMDNGDICALAELDGWMCQMVKLIIMGPKRVEGKNSRKLLNEALAEHANNINAGEATKNIFYVDDGFGESGFQLKDVSPYGLKSQIEASQTPMHIWLGWLDAATIDGALKRYNSFSNSQHLVIGPYSHGGGFNTDPFAEKNAKVEPSPGNQSIQMAREFFDCYLKTDTSCAANRPHKSIKYYTMNEGVWRTTNVWPPKEIDERYTLFFDEGNKLSTHRQDTLNTQTYKVDFTHTTGKQNRWFTNLSGNDVVYPNRAEEDAKLLTYTGDPLPQDMEITGSPMIHFHIASSHEDANFIAYLESVDPEGNVTYITEGILRASNRKTIPCPDSLWSETFGPCRSYKREDAEALPVGKTAEITFSLFSTSVLVKKGHRIRVALAGADQSFLQRFPEEVEPAWTIYSSPNMESGISLPIRWR